MFIIWGQKHNRTKSQKADRKVGGWGVNAYGQLDRKVSEIFGRLPLFLSQNQTRCPTSIYRMFIKAVLISQHKCQVSKFGRFP